MALPSSWVRCVFLLSMAPQWTKATITCAAAVSGPGRSHGLASGFARLRLGGRTRPVGMMVLGGSTRCDQKLRCLRKMKFLALPKKGFCLEVMMVGCFTTSCDMYHADFLWKAPFIKQ